MRLDGERLRAVSVSRTAHTNALDGVLRVKTAGTALPSARSALVTLRAGHLTYTPRGLKKDGAELHIPLFQTKLNLRGNEIEISGKEGTFTLVASSEAAALPWFDALELVVESRERAAARTTTQQLKSSKLQQKYDLGGGHVSKAADNSDSDSDIDADDYRMARQNIAIAKADANELTDEADSSIVGISVAKPDDEPVKKGIVPAKTFIGTAPSQPDPTQTHHTGEHSTESLKGKRHWLRIEFDGAHAAIASGEIVEEEEPTIFDSLADTFSSWTSSLFGKKEENPKGAGAGARRARGSVVKGKLVAGVASGDSDSSDDEDSDENAKKKKKKTKKSESEAAGKGGKGKKGESKASSSSSAGARAVPGRRVIDLKKIKERKEAEARKAAAEARGVDEADLPDDDVGADGGAGAEERRRVVQQLTISSPANDDDDLPERGGGNEDDNSEDSDSNDEESPSKKGPRRKASSSDLKSTGKSSANAPISSAVGTGDADGEMAKPLDSELFEFKEVVFVEDDTVRIAPSATNDIAGLTSETLLAALAEANTLKAYRIPQDVKEGLEGVCWCYFENSPRGEKQCRKLSTTLVAIGGVPVTCYTGHEYYLRLMEEERLRREAEEAEEAERAKLNPPGVKRVRAVNVLKPLQNDAVLPEGEAHGYLEIFRSSATSKSKKSSKNRKSWESVWAVIDEGNLTLFDKHLDKETPDEERQQIGAYALADFEEARRILEIGNGWEMIRKDRNELLQVTIRAASEKSTMLWIQALNRAIDSASSS